MVMLETVERLVGRYNKGGWSFVNDVWTRTGNFTFTVPGNKVNEYRKGTKVRYNDGSLEYGVIGSSSHSAGTTTVTLITNSDYAMANTTLTECALSYIENPDGFPDVFNYQINFNVNGTINLSAISDADFKWSVTGRIITLYVYMNTGTTTGSANSVISMSIPVNAAGLVGGACKVRDGATINIITGWWVIEAGLASIGIGLGTSGATQWGIGTGRHINGVFEYIF